MSRSRNVLAGRGLSNKYLRAGYNRALLVLNHSIQAGAGWDLGKPGYSAREKRTSLTTASRHPHGPITVCHDIQAVNQLKLPR